MFSAKVLNGFNMARMGRFDVEHNPDDDRIIVYVKADDGQMVRVYINADGTTSRENVTGTTFDDEPVGGAESTEEVTIGMKNIELHLHANGSVEVLDSSFIENWLNEYASDWFESNRENHVEVWHADLRPIDEVANSIAGVRELIARSMNCK